MIRMRRSTGVLSASILILLAVAVLDVSPDAVAANAEAEAALEKIDVGIGICAVVGLPLRIPLLFRMCACYIGVVAVSLYVLTITISGTPSCLDHATEFSELAASG